MTVLRHDYAGSHRIQMGLVQNMTVDTGYGLHRRRLLTFIGAAAAGIMPLDAMGAIQTTAKPVTDGDCTNEPSVQMLSDWGAGKPIYASIAESGPQIDWVPSGLPVPMLPYLIPPDWRAVTGQCDAIDRDGVPQWTNQQLQVPWLTLARVLNKDSTAAFEYIVGNIQGQPLTPQQVTTIARASLLGPDPKLKAVCSVDSSADPLAPMFFSADRYEDSLLLTSVTALGLPDVFLPATTVSITSIFGPRDEMEDLMHDVFLRILFQFLGGGSSSDDEDDDDDDDDPDDSEDDGTGHYLPAVALTRTRFG